MLAAHSCSCRSLRAVIGAFILASFAGAAELPKAAAILEENCLKCHNSSVRMSGLSLVTAADAAKGGVHGPAIVPGKPDESLLLRMISGRKAEDADAGHAAFRPRRWPRSGSWIEAGAPWPEELRADRKKGELWSLQPLSKPPVPRVESKWVRTPSMRSSSPKLKAMKLTPSPEADRATLIRRLTYDLHGLPPTWEEIQAFVADRLARRL